jgi:hypothetical protein
MPATRRTPVATIAHAAWRGLTDLALKRRLLQARNDYNRARRHMAWQRRRQVYGLWYRWREKYGPHRGLQTLIAAHLGVHKSTICRDLQRIFPLMTDRHACGQLRPRHWWDDA